MTKIKLVDGTEITALMVNGASRFYQNANRDTLEFVFDETQSMDNLNVIFSDKENLRTIAILQEDNSYTYNDYIIQVSLSKEMQTVVQETSDSPAEQQARIKVVMAQQTYTEKLIQQLLNK